MKLNRIAAISIVGILAIGAAGTAPVAAKKPTKPDVPVIVKITSSQVSKKVQKVTVTLEKPANDGGSPIIDMTVQIMGKKCVIKKSASACTIKDAPLIANSRPFILFWARNKVGASKHANYRYYLSSMGSWVKTGYTPAGVKFPVVKINRSLSRVINGRSVKWSKFQAIRRSSVTSARVHQRVPSVGTPSVTFNITGVVGLALPANSGSGATSGMLAVQSDGSAVDSLMAGSLSASIRDFYSAPNGRFYVTFVAPTALVQGGATCVLAEVDANTGIPTCVDSAITSVQLSPLIGAQSLLNPPVQFDDQGNIYYSGQMNGKFVLRKSINGTVTSLINDNITMNDFFVMGDGSVLLNGRTTSPASTWFRKLSPSNSLSSLTVQSSSTVSFIRRFPDGNVYFGIDSSQVEPTGVKRILTSTGAVDSAYWLIQGTNYSTKVDSRYSLAPYCTMATNSTVLPKFCTYPGYSTQFVTTTDGHVLGRPGGGLLQFYPTVEPGNTTLWNVTLMYQVGSKVVLAGTNANGTNMLTLYDPATYQETVITDATNEVEVYAVAYIESTQKLLFNGLRFSDNQVVVGEVDFSSL